MKLSTLIQNISIKEIIGDRDVDVSDIKIDSNQVGNGSLFICIKGNDFDGHDFIRQVEQYGAVAVVCQKKLNTSITQIIVDDTRKAMGEVCGVFYGNVDKSMKIIAVLGTNGKTSTAHLIRNVLESNNVKCGVIGTIGTYYNNVYVEPKLTTPDPIELYQTLSDMYKSGIKTVVMEVSAHAMYYDKVKSIKFFAGIFTNFTQDHLDFFGDMDSYKRAKMKFFENNECEYVVVNSDDELGVEISNKCKNVITYGIENPADVFAIDVNSDANGNSFVINLFDCIYDVKLKMVGKFNVYNALACASICALMGIKPQSVISALEKEVNVSGRIEKVYDKGFKVFIDYAHTPDGLEKVLSSLKKVSTNRLISVFGCGGNRDRLKRSLMGEISAKIADLTVITTDNPRYEEPMDIIREIEKGVLKTNKRFISIEDRRQAIYYALDLATEGDCVLISGKGSEKYQEILGIKKPYNDKDTVSEYFRRKSI